MTPNKPPKAAKINEKVIRHFIFVEVPIEVVWPQLLAWSAAEWWPKGSHIKMISSPSGEVQVGTRLRHTLTKPLAPKWDPLAVHWDTEVTKLLDKNLMERTFVRGPIKGYETVQLEWRYNGTRIDYELHYRVKGLHNMIFWTLTSEKLFSQSIKMALDSFKNHIYSVYKDIQEKDHQ